MKLQRNDLTIVINIISHYEMISQFRPLYRVLNQINNRRTKG